jgi:hypothetical protein
MIYHWILLRPAYKYEKLNGQSWLIIILYSNQIIMTKSDIKYLNTLGTFFETNYLMIIF